MSTYKAVKELDASLLAGEYTVDVDTSVGDDYLQDVVEWTEKTSRPVGVEGVVAPTHQMTAGGVNVVTGEATRLRIEDTSFALRSNLHSVGATAVATGQGDSTAGCQLVTIATDDINLAAINEAVRVADPVTIQALGEAARVPIRWFGQHEAVPATDVSLSPGMTETYQLASGGGGIDITVRVADGDLDSDALTGQGAYRLQITYMVNDGTGPLTFDLDLDTAGTDVLYNTALTMVSTVIRAQVTQTGSGIENPFNTNLSTITVERTSNPQFVFATIAPGYSRSFGYPVQSWSGHRLVLGRLSGHASGEVTLKVARFSRGAFISANMAPELRIVVSGAFDIDLSQMDPHEPDSVLHVWASASVPQSIFCSLTGWQVAD